MLKRLKLWIIAYLAACLAAWPSICPADARALSGLWYQAPEDWSYQEQADLAAAGLKPVTQVDRTGGRFWQQADFDIETAGRHVLDFKNTSIIGHFRHILLDAQNHPVAAMQGGIQSSEANPFFLRHGREIDLPSGHYRLLTELDSPFFLADPQPYLDTLDNYRQAIKPWNAMTLLCLGIFTGLLAYYSTLAIARRSVSDAMYSLFILGNLLFNGMALLVFPDLFGIHWMYLVSFPILFSNCAYVHFVMALLNIRPDNYPYLRAAGKMLFALLTGLIVLAAIMPNRSLEIDRYGVGLFLIYGLIAGIIRSWDGSRTARYYLCAIGTFSILGIATISANGLNAYTVYVEHMGLLSVAIEIILLALVITYQFTRLLKAKRLAEESSRIKSEFLAIMSHEIRTPMNAIVGISELVLNQDVSPNVRQYLEKIRIASDNLLSILNDILDFSKAESGCINIEKVRFNLDDMLENLENLFSLRAKEKQIELTIKAAPNVPREIIGDTLRIQQILTNLLSNAIKFTERGKVLLTIDLKHAENASVTLEFCVEDTGIGISKDDLTKLFLPFSQVDGSITRRFGGTGLGLAISQRLLQLMGSTFQVYSTPGMGSRFSFELTLDSPIDSVIQHLHHGKLRDAGTLTSTLSMTGKTLASARILVAEDNETNQIIIKDILELSGLGVEIANNGKQVLELLNKTRFDAVLMDVHMPEMDGIETTRRIREQSCFAGLPIIALTAGVTCAERENCLASGANDFITKPFTPETLVATLVQWINHQDSL